MRYFDFSGLIEKYAADFILERAEGVYDEKGDWREVVKREPMRGAVMDVTEARLYRPDGVWKEKDKALYLTEPLGDIAAAYAVYAGQRYKVQAAPENNPDFTGVWAYQLKAISD